MKQNFVKGSNIYEWTRNERMGLARLKAGIWRLEERSGGDMREEGAPCVWGKRMLNTRF
jgi:hypothetical protein